MVKFGGRWKKYSPAPMSLTADIGLHWVAAFSDTRDSTHLILRLGIQSSTHSFCVYFLLCFLFFSLAWEASYSFGSFIILLFFTQAQPILTQNYKHQSRARIPLGIGSSLRLSTLNAIFLYKNGGVMRLSRKLKCPFKIPHGEWRDVERLCNHYHLRKCQFYYDQSI